jgi:hypothetical protein
MKIERVYRPYLTALPWWAKSRMPCRVTLEGHPAHHACRLSVNVKTAAVEAFIQYDTRLLFKVKNIKWQRYKIKKSCWNPAGKLRLLVFCLSGILHLKVTALILWHSLAVEPLR